VSDSETGVQTLGAVISSHQGKGVWVPFGVRLLRQWGIGLLVDEVEVEALTCNGKCRLLLPLTVVLVTEEQ
jgi:hypothetical protein